MFLKELHMAGFKSFAHAIRLELGPGVTAVVGPNGSGKSNIVDAVRWVLGEQSPRTLRGAKGEDVIFGGSVARHALGMAEVSLVLDNGDGRVPLDVAEVVVARRLYRSGETDYLLNRRRVRLRDVLDIAGQAGLGPDSYCVVGQGAIEQLAMQRPQERRGLIADAADIRRHEARLAAIESDLTQTQQNALRVAAVVAEVRPQLDRLRTQAERAERHRRVREEIEAVARTWYGRAIPRAREHLVAAERHRLKLQAEIAESRNRLAAAEQHRAALHETGLALRAQADALAAALGPARERRETLRVERAKVAERHRSLAARLNEVTADLGKVASEARVAEQTAAVSRAALESTGAEKGPGGKSDEGGLLAEADARLTALRHQHREAQVQLDDARRRLEAVEREATRLEVAQEAARSAEAARAAQRAESQARHAELEAQAAQAERQLAADQAEAKISAGKLDEARSAHEVVRGARQAAEHACITATRSLDGLLGEERVLAQFAAGSTSAPGTGPSQAGIPSADPRPGRFVLSGYLPVPLRYQMAIAAALGSAAWYYVVDAEDTAWSVDAGTSAVTGNGEANVLVPERARNAGDTDGFRAWVARSLAGHVAYRLAVDLLLNEANAGLAARYLGTTIVTTDLAQARAAATRLAGRADAERSFQVATEDGHCLRWNGEHVLGPEAPASQVIEARVRQAALAERIASARAAALRGEGELAAARATEADAAREVRAVEEACRAISARVQGHEKALQTLRTEAQRQRTRAEIEEGRPAGAGQIPLLPASGALSVHRQGLLAEVQRSQAMLDAQDGELAAAEATRREALEKQLAAVSRQAIAAERIARLQDAVERDTREEARLRQREEALRGEMSRLEAELQTLAERSATLDCDLIPAEQAMEAFEVQRAENAAALAQHDEAAEAGIAEQQAVQFELADLRAAEATAGADVENAAGRLDRLQVELSGLAESLAREPDELMDGGSVGSVPGLGELDDESLERRLSRAQRELRNVGGVDYGVLAEYGVLKDRYTHLTEQLDDLNRAEVQIREGMAEARERMRTQFATVFEDVNARFQDLFRALFGGGDAELLLVGDAGSPQGGVDIVAQPPGKRLHRLATLSGGERSLVGAALLLALIGSNPSPFCVLDEVDAALDDANVSRFAGTIREMAQRTQFILVTHNRATMEMADALYGVTMTAGAVSQVLAIRLPD